LEAPEEPLELEAPEEPLELEEPEEPLELEEAPKTDNSLEEEIQNAVGELSDEDLQSEMDEDTLLSIAENEINSDIVDVSVDEDGEIDDNDLKTVMMKMMELNH